MAGTIPPSNGLGNRHCAHPGRAQKIRAPQIGLCALGPPLRGFPIFGSFLAIFPILGSFYPAAFQPLETPPQRFSNRWKFLRPVSRCARNRHALKAEATGPGEGARAGLPEIARGEARGAVFDAAAEDGRRRDAVWQAQAAGGQGTRFANCVPGLFKARRAAAWLLDRVMPWIPAVRTRGPPRGIVVAARLQRGAVKTAPETGSTRAVPPARAPHPPRRPGYRYGTSHIVRGLAANFPNLGKISRRFFRTLETCSGPFSKDWELRRRGQRPGPAERRRNCGRGRAASRFSKTAKPRPAQGGQAAGGIRIKILPHGARFCLNGRRSNSPNRGRKP